MELADRFSPHGENRAAAYDWLLGQRATSGGSWLLSAAARVHEFCRTDQAYVEYPQSTDGALIRPRDDTTNPLLGCRNNFHVMVTAGEWSDTPGSPVSGAALALPANPGPSGALWLDNNDGTRTALPRDSVAVAAIGLSRTYDPSVAYATQFADLNRGMLADLVFASWITDLRPDEPAAEQRVPTLIRKRNDADRPETWFWDPVNDPADWQHITTYTVGLGVSGNVVYPDGHWTYRDRDQRVSSGTVKADGFPGDWNAIGAGLYDQGLNATQVPAAIKIDDLWHAGINGRGGYWRAGDVEALGNALSQALRAAATVAAEGSATAAVVSTGRTANEDLIYQARLNTKDWSGDIRSFQVSGGLGQGPCPDAQVLPGQLCQDSAQGASYRSAARAIRGRSHRDRRLFTAASGTGVAFSAREWEALTDVQRRDFLRGAGFTGDDPLLATAEQVNEAQRRLDYVAGDQTYEQDGLQYRFRTRGTLLGDFINAGPLLVGAPAFHYNAPGYQLGVGNGVGFRQAHQDRRQLVYAGANDGMLHAFDGDSLEEVFAFIPPVLMGLAGDTRPLVEQPGLHVLSDPAYGGGALGHRAFVDGPLASGDVRLGDAAQGDWRTVLIGGLGLGAQALYALDISVVPGAETSVGAFADAMYLWQFTDREADGANAASWDPDLGYVFGRPAIVRIRGANATSDPIWVAITGNGYNSAEADGSRAAGCEDETKDQGERTCGQAVLYVIEIETGKLIKKFSTGIGRKDDPKYPSAADATRRRPNALGQATIVATTQHQDGDLLADFAYAADLFGNLYRFDLTGEDKQPIRRLFSATASGPGEDAGRPQPITSPVAVARHPLEPGDPRVVRYRKVFGHR